MRFQAMPTLEGRRRFLYRISCIQAGLILAPLWGHSAPVGGAQSVIYIVKKGDTLTHIGRRYNVSVRQLKRANGLSSDLIRIGLKLVIPSRKPKFRYIAEVVAATEAIKVERRRWRIVVGHHSGIDRGNAKTYHRYHLEQRRMENGLAYHFVIGNGIDSDDGQIEIGNRWLKQLHGGHVKKEKVNEVGIGICVVGNFEKHRPSRKQLEAFSELVQYLREDIIRVPSRFAVHKEIDPGRTVCPGRYFPVSAMHRRFPS